MTSAKNIRVEFFIFLLLTLSFLLLSSCFCFAFAENGEAGALPNGNVVPVVAVQDNMILTTSGSGFIVDQAISEESTLPAPGLSAVDEALPETVMLSESEIPSQSEMDVLTSWNVNYMDVSDLRIKRNDHGKTTMNFEYRDALWKLDLIKNEEDEVEVANASIEGSVEVDQMNIRVEGDLTVNGDLILGNKTKLLIKNLSLVNGFLMTAPDAQVDIKGLLRVGASTDKGPWVQNRTADNPNGTFRVGNVLIQAGRIQEIK